MTASDKARQYLKAATDHSTIATAGERRHMLNQAECLFLADGDSATANVCRYLRLGIDPSGQSSEAEDRAIANPSDPIGLACHGIVMRTIGPRCIDELLRLIACDPEVLSYVS